MQISKMNQRALMILVAATILVAELLVLFGLAPPIGTVPVYGVVSVLDTDGEVRTPVQVSILVDGKPLKHVLGNEFVTLHLYPGSHILQCRAQGYRPAKDKVGLQVTDGDNYFGYELVGTAPPRK